MQETAKCGANTYSGACGRNCIVHWLYQCMAVYSGEELLAHCGTLGWSQLQAGQPSDNIPATMSTRVTFEWLPLLALNTCFCRHWQRCCIVSLSSTAPMLPCATLPCCAVLCYLVLCHAMQAPKGPYLSAHTGAWQQQQAWDETRPPTVGDL